MPDINILTFITLFLKYISSIVYYTIYMYCFNAQIRMYSVCDLLYQLIKMCVMFGLCFKE